MNLLTAYLSSVILWLVIMTIYYIIKRVNKREIKVSLEIIILSSALAPLMILVALLILIPGINKRVEKLIINKL